MASPITWRNVEAPDLRGAAAMLGQAQASLNSGFGHINDVLKNERATADANWSQIRDNNTQTFLDSIAQYRTAEDFQAAQQAGALDQLRSQFGPQIDRAAIRAAEDGRLATLQGRDVQAINYGNTMTDHKEAPTKQQVMADILAGKLKPEDLQQYSGNRFFLDAAGKLRDVSRQNTEWAQADTKFAREGEKHSSDLLSAATDRQYKGALTSNARSAGSSATAALKAELAASKAQNGAADLLIKNSPLDAGTMDTYAGQKAFEEGLSKLGLKPEQVKSIRESYAKEFKNGVLVGYDENNEEVRIGLPVSTALAGARDSADNWYTPNFLNVSNQGKSAVKNLKEQIGSPTYVNSLQQALQAQGVRYRPLNQPANTQFTKQSPSADGAALVNSAIESRKAKAAAAMTPEELQIARTTGVVPSRVKRILEEDE